MDTCLKIGDRLLDSSQVISGLVQYKLLGTFIEQVLLDDLIKEIPLSREELFHTLVGTTDVAVPEDFEGFLSQWCQQRGVVPDYFNNVLLRDLRVQKLKYLYFSNQVESEFLQAKADFDQVEYSVVQVTDLWIAQELYFLLRDDGAEFTQLAHQYLSGYEHQLASWIGPVSLSTLPVEIASLLQHGSEGTLYGPIPVANQFWIVRLERLIPARLTEATRAALVDRLFNRWLQAQSQALMETPGTIAVQTQPSALIGTELSRTEPIGIEG